MSRRDRCLQTVVDKLRRQIDDSFAPGAILPSQHELAAMHGVGQTTVYRALRNLERDGVVKAVRRVGWFRSSTRRQSARKSGRRGLIVGVMSRLSAEEWPKYQIYQALRDEARKRKIGLIEVPNAHFIRPTSRRNSIALDRVPWNKFDVGLLVEAEDTIRLSDPALLARRVLAIDQNATGFGFDSVAFADEQAGALAAKHLLDLGHMRFAVTEELNDPGIPADPAWTARRHGYERTIGDAGGTLLPQWRLVIPRRTYHSNVAARIEKVVRETAAVWMAAPASQRPTALFALTPHPLVLGTLTKEYARHGLRVPRDLSIVTVTLSGQIYGGGDLQEYGIQYSRVDFDLSVLVRRTMDAALELNDERWKRGRRPRRAPRLYLAPATLLRGRSTVAPSRS